MDDLKELIKITQEQAEMINYFNSDSVEKIVKAILRNQSLIAENLAIIMESSLDTSESIAKHWEMHANGEL